MVGPVVAVGPVEVTGTAFFVNSEENLVNNDGVGCSVFGTSFGVTFGAEDLKKSNHPPRFLVRIRLVRIRLVRIRLLYILSLLIQLLRSSFVQFSVFP